MQIKTEELKKTYDYIIIGAGIIGMTILRELVEKGKKNILIIESGSMLSEDPYPKFMNVRSKKFKIKSKSRFNGVGGSSNVWGAICAIFDEETINNHFKKKVFPINFQEYSHFLKQSEKYGYPKLNDFKIDRSLNKTLNKKKFIQKIPSIRYFHFSSILESESVDFLQNSFVEKVDKSNKIFFTSQKSRNINNSTNAKKIILCANTIENYKILKKSNLDTNLDKLGKGFMNHTKGVVGSIIANEKLNDFLSKKLDDSITYFGIQLKNSSFKHYLKINKGFKIPILDYMVKWLNGNNNLYEGSFSVSSSQITVRLLYLIELFLNLLDKIFGIFYKNYYHIEAFTEIKCRDENYISYDKKNKKTTVSYDLSVNEINSLKKLLEEFESKFKTKILFKPKSISKLKKLVSFDSSHHMGGMVCGESKENSIVDLSLRVHGTKSIYICGGGIFPFSGIANPTISYVALAIWLSKKVL
tara:strand:- start:12836 stop:14248 length:1413 start_codon:yes stop_codon:yes gene_type:complete